MYMRQIPVIGHKLKYDINKVLSRVINNTIYTLIWFRFIHYSHSTVWSEVCWKCFRIVLSRLLFIKKLPFHNLTTLPISLKPGYNIFILSGHFGTPILTPSMLTLVSQSCIERPDYKKLWYEIWQKEQKEWLIFGPNWTNQVFLGKQDNLQRPFSLFLEITYLV